MDSPSSGTPWWRRQPAAAAPVCPRWSVAPIPVHAWGRRQPPGRAPAAAPATATIPVCCCCCCCCTLPLPLALPLPVLVTVPSAAVALALACALPLCCCKGPAAAAARGVWHSRRPRWQLHLWALLGLHLVLHPARTKSKQGSHRGFLRKLTFHKLPIRGCNRPQQCHTH
jgi:hypothetical protein